MFLSDLLAKIGDSLLRYVDKAVTYEEAKSDCEANNTALVEFWNEKVWNEVNNARVHWCMPCYKLHINLHLLPCERNKETVSKVRESFGKMQQCFNTTK